MRKDKFDAGDTIVIESPFTGMFEANFRGWVTDCAVVWTGKSQITIPAEWIKGKKDNKEV